MVDTSARVPRARLPLLGHSRMWRVLSSAGFGFAPCMALDVRLLAS